MVNKIVEKSSEENKLMARIESITAENDFTKEQLSALKAKYENIKNGEISGLLKPLKDPAGKLFELYMLHYKFHSHYRNINSAIFPVTSILLLKMLQM